MEPATLKLLTKRELSILQLIADGHSTPEVSTMLSLSSYTVYTHRRNILRKMGKKDITAVVLLALQYKVLHAPTLVA